MRKVLLAAAGFAALAGMAGLAMAQDNGPAAATVAPAYFQSDTNNDGVVTRAEFDAGRAASSRVSTPTMTAN